jgi:hypothetical protein
MQWKHAMGYYSLLICINIIPAMGGNVINIVAIIFILILALYTYITNDK